MRWKVCWIPLFSSINGDDYEECVEEAKKEHIYAREPHYAQSQLDENLVNLAKKLVDHNLANPAIVIFDDNEVVIGVVNVIVNPTINIVDVNFDQNMLAMTNICR